MKIKGIILITLVFVSLTFISFKYSEKFVYDANPQSIKFNIPENVNTIIKNKCYDCHNSSAKNKKSKTKLNFDKLNTLKVYKLVAKLDNISESVREGEMPPKKAVKKYPQLKLSKEEANTLINWAEEYIRKYEGE